MAVLLVNVVSDLESSRRSKAHKPNAEQTTTSLTWTCHNAVRNSAKYPIKVSFCVTRHGERLVRYRGVKHWHISGAADMMNSFGALLPHDFSCLVSLDGETLVDIGIEE
jgi:hypothetical protein